MQLILPIVGNSLTKATSFSKNASEVRRAPEYLFTNILCSLNISALPGLRCTAFLGEMGLQLIKPQGPLKREELTTVCLPDCSVDADNLEWEAKQKVEPDWAGAGPSHLPPPLDPLCLELSENTGVPSPHPNPPVRMDVFKETAKHIGCWRKMQGKWILAPCHWEWELVQSHGNYHGYSSENENPAGPLLRTQWNLSHPPKFLCIHAYCCTIHSNQVMTVAQVLTDGWTDKKYVAYVYSRILSAIKKKSMSFLEKKICENRRAASKEGSH